jgi:hypothetical protein
VRRRDERGEDDQEERDEDLQLHFSVLFSLASNS